MLEKVWHEESGGDSPRIPFLPQAGEKVEIWAGSYPIEAQQQIWIEYRTEGSGPWQKQLCNWQYNSRDNSYWRTVFTSIPAGTLLEYKVRGRQGNVTVGDSRIFSFTPEVEFVPAPGAPGTPPSWTTGAKEGFGTARNDQSRVWFTLSRGIITEVYFPALDKPNIRDFQFMVSDGSTFAHAAGGEMDYRLEYPDPKALAYTMYNSDKQGDYEICQKIFTHPSDQALLIKMKYLPLSEKARGYKIYALLNPHIDNSGAGDTTRLLNYRGRDLFLSYENGIYLAVLCSRRFRSSTCGFVGVNDGYKLLKEHYTIPAPKAYTYAARGNTSLLFELDLSRDSEETICLGFGHDEKSALDAACNALESSWEAMWAEYIYQWQDYCAGLTGQIEAYAGINKQLAYVSAMVLKSCEDKAYKGAMIASPSIPWGERTGDENSGGYHLVWSRDLYQVATAFMSVGDYASALAALKYLDHTQQEADGSFPQNSWLNGEPYWRNKQMDEAAYPIILAWRLHKAGQLDYNPYYSLVKPAAEFITLVGPGTAQERWEEAGGLSPSTLAAEIAGLVCAGKFAEEQVKAGDLKEQAAADWYYRKADEWQRQVERWCFVQGTGYFGDKYYYLRSNPDTPLDANPSDEDTVTLANNAGSWWARDVIDAGFFELVRLGVKAADDYHINASLDEVDKVIRVNLNGEGPGFYRYNHDNYGYDVEGVHKGRLWPLLTGERAHFELANGRDVELYLRWMEYFANKGLMLPEQVWDEEAIPEHHLFPGKGTGGATPLAWSHAEYLKLLRSRHDGKIFDLIAEVSERYR